MLDKYFKDQRFQALFSDIIFIVLVLGATLLLTRIILKSLERTLLRKSDPKRKTIFSVLSNLIHYLFYFLALTIVLDNFGVSTHIITAVAGMGSLAIGFGAQTLVKDIISGLFIITESQFNVDDVVELAGYVGTVEEMNFRTTKLRTSKGELCIIPNGEIRSLKNLSVDYINANVTIPVSFDEDIEEVVRILESDLENFLIEDAMIEKAKVLAVMDFSDYAMTLRITCRCFVGKNWSVERELRLRVKKLFDLHKIRIAYPKTILERES